MRGLLGVLNEERGSTIVEFVLVAQVMFLLLFGLVDMAVLLNTKLVMIHAAREGLRRATIEGGADPSVYDQIETQLQLGTLAVDRANVTVTPKHASYGTPISVVISYQFQPLTPVARVLFGSSLPLRTELTGRSERLR